MAYTNESNPIPIYYLPKVLWKKIIKILIKFIPGNLLRIILLRSCGFKIGGKVYIGEDFIVTEILEDFSEKLIIEDRVSIAQRVTVITASDPNYSRLYDYVKIKRGKVHIKNDAWIGAGVIILPNITIGEYSIIGAGAVVTKDIPPFSIAAGIPAKVLKKIELNKQ